jgi:hypothetical protein
VDFSCPGVFFAVDLYWKQGGGEGPIQNHLVVLRQGVQGKVLAVGKNRFSFANEWCGMNGSKEVVVL